MNPPPSPVYLDNNATTALDPDALAAMQPFLARQYANPSSPYTFARGAALAVLRAREQVAALLSVDPSRIAFTSGGTESNNTALWGALALRPERRHLVTTTVEHASVRAVVDEAERRGHPVTRVTADREGRLDLAALRAAATRETAVVSVMAANNETGVLFDVGEVARLAHAHGALLHTDAVQAAGKVPFDALAAGADLVSVGAHKLHGPKGVGALYAREGIDLPPLLRGGDQEFGRRAGTENVAGIVGFGRAAELAAARLDELSTRVRALRDAMEARLAAAIAGLRVVAATSPRLPNTSLMLIDGVDTEALLARLDLLGLCCSSGSACAAGAHEPSRVLRAMGLLPAAGGPAALRVSLSRWTTAAEVDILVDAVAGGVHVLRSTGAKSESLHG